VTSHVLSSSFASQFASSGNFTLLGSFGTEGSGDGQFGFPWGVAVKQSTGDVYVADLGNNRVEKFNTAGGYVSQFAATDASGLAVDQASGDVYVSEEGNNQIDKYDSSGTLITSFGSSGPGDGQLSAPIALAVDQSSGDVYVADNGNGRVDEFSASGSFLQSITGTPGGSFSNVWEVAVDSAGNLYIDDAGQGVYKFSSSGTYQSTLESGAPSGVAIDGSDNVFVLQPPTVFEYGSSGAQIGSFPATGLAATSLGMAFGNTAGVLYVAQFTAHDVAMFGSPVSHAPSVDAESSSGVTPVSATVSTQVNPNNADSTCEFEYVDQADYNPLAPDPYGAGHTTACSPADLGAGGADVPAAASLSGLTPSTTYHWRVAATNAVGSTGGADETFTTLPPVSIAFARASAVTETGAALSAELNPNGAAASYHFEYGTADCSSAPCASVPVPDASAGSGTRDVTVTAAVSGLAAGTTYHYRLVATNTFGTVASTDHTFVTFSAPAPQESCANSRPGYSADLPDCRAYEQVTPVDKNGTNPSGVVNVIQAATGGDAITFFSQAGIPGGSGEQDFPLYLATRGASGWSTQGLLPPAAVAPVAGVLGWSPDLSEVFDTATTGDGQTSSLYLRDSSDGSLTPMASGPNSGSFFFDATSSDGSEVLFESTDQLTSNAAAGLDNVYVWDRNTNAVTLVGLLPDGSTPSGGSFPGAYNWQKAVTARGGSEQGLYTQNTLSADGSKVFFTTGGAAQLYMRENPTSQSASTIQVSATQKTNGAGPAGSDPNGPKPAAFMSATPDGSQVLFTSSEELTNDATTGSADQGSDLYLYKTATGALSDLTRDVSDPDGADVQGVLGTSADGAYVYFVANGVLADGASPGSCQIHAGSCNLYVWHQGTISFIARLDAAGGESVHGFGGQQFVGYSDEFNWEPGDGITSASVERTARVTPDGQVLLFASQEQLTGYDNAGYSELYRYDAGRSQLQCVSCDATGAAPTSNATLQDIQSFAGVATASTLTRNLSDRGDQVFFESADPLVSQATNGVQNVYEWEADGAGSCQSNGGCIYLVSSGRGPDPSYFADASASGNDAFFFTSQSLVGQDQDNLVDVYDARVDGGLRSQNPTSPPAPCGEDTCRGSVGLTPAVPLAGSITFQGAGDSAAPAGLAVPAGVGRVQVLGGRVHGTTFYLRVRVPAAGTITIIGTGIRGVRRSLDAAGSYRLRIVLTPKMRGRLRKHDVQLKLRVGYQSAGGPLQLASVNVSVKSALPHAGYVRPALATSRNAGGAR